MSRASQGAATAAARTDLLGRLGLTPGADEQAVAETHERIVEFLDGAPDDLRGWADRRQREADKVFALLTGPESDLAPVAERLAPAPAPAAARRGLPRPVMVLLGLLAGVGVVIGVYYLGNPPSAVPAMTAANSTAAPQGGIDQAKVAELMGKIQANPQDTASLQSLGNIYYGVNDYATAKTFYDKILAYDAKNEKALIASGAAAFNSGDLASAEKVWTTAAAEYPNNAEVHYDLGFLYMTTQRTDLMKAEWDKVVAIDPTSELAKTVQSHVGSVKSPSPSPTPSK